MAKLQIDRTILARFLPTPQAIATFEAMLRQIDTIGTLGQQDAGAVDITGGQIGLSAGAAGAPSLRFGDDETGFYRVGLDEIGLAVAGVQLLALAANLLSVAGDIEATGQLKSTVATGTAPLEVASTTKVVNLYADRAALADEATHAGSADSATTATSATMAAGLSSPHAFPADASDLATAITLVNALKAAALAKGL